MKKTIVLLLAPLMLMMVSCNPRRDNVEKIEKIEKELMASKMTTLDTAKASALIIRYHDFANDYPNDTLAPIYLFRASDLCMNMQRGDEAIKYLDQILTNYPKFKKTEEALFLKGFVAENITHNLVLAEKCYREFLRDFSSHTLAKDAEASLKNLGKSPEELIKEFELKNATADSLKK